MLQKSSIAPEQVKVDNTSKSLLNKISKVVCSLYQAKEVIKNVYGNIMNSV